MVSVTNERCSARKDHEESTNIKGLEDVRDACVESRKSLITARKSDEEQRMEYRSRSWY